MSKIQIQRIDPVVVEPREVRLTQAQYNNLRSNQVGRNVLALSCGVVVVLIGLLCVVSAFSTDEGVNRSCESNCSSISIF